MRAEGVAALSLRAVARAVGVEPQSMYEWARRHGQPFTLVLTGPAGARSIAAAGATAMTLTKSSSAASCRAWHRDLF
jgi:hypothetical protein